MIVASHRGKFCVVVCHHVTVRQSLTATYSVSRKECNESFKLCLLKATMTTFEFIAHADEVTSQL